MADQTDGPTRYGFRWGVLEVSRAAEHRGHRVITLRTDRERLDVRITPTGLIRIDGPVTKVKR